MSTINDTLVLAGQKSTEGKQFKVVNNKHVPYSNSAEVLAVIPVTRRHIGQIFRVDDGAGIADWEFVGGIADGNLTKKGTVGGGSNVVMFNKNIDSSYAIAAGEIISGIIIDTAVDETIKIGTTDGGNEIAIADVTGGRPEPVTLLHYAKTAELIYFTGIVATTTFILIKNSIPT